SVGSQCSVLPPDAGPGAGHAAIHMRRRASLESNSIQDPLQPNESIAPCSSSGRFRSPRLFRLRKVVVSSCPEAPQVTKADRDSSGDSSREDMAPSWEYLLCLLLECERTFAKLVFRAERKERLQYR